MFNNDPNDPHHYDDLLDLPHPTSPTHPRMSRHDRAAQFAPFAALTGYGEAIEEVRRLTDERIELGESDRAALNARMAALRERLKSRPVVTITRFIPDRRKAGGRYEPITGVVRRLLPEAFELHMEDGTVIDLDNIIGLDGELFDRLGLP